MGLRRRVGSTLEATIGPERTQALRGFERRARERLAGRIQPPTTPAPAAAPSRRPPTATSPAARGPGPHQGRRRGGRRAGAGPGGVGLGRAGLQRAAPRLQRSDPFEPHPRPTMSRHALLERLHELLQPRTYLEIGVNTGASLALSRARSVGIDPAFSIVRELRCDLHLVRAASDDFFAGADPLAHLRGTPVDLAFIDGMHLSDFALRDFLHAEPHMARTGVVVLDDMLPRNPLEAARDRRTATWAGDVYKVAEVLMRRRPDLLVLMVNTAPTGTTVVVRLDPASTVLAGCYDEELPYLLAEDPQPVPQGFLDRSIAVDPVVLLDSPVWGELPALRDAGEAADAAAVTAMWKQLEELPRLG